MPKMKSKRSAVKRFRMTKNGKIMYNKRGMRKKLSKKSKSRKRTLNKPGVLSSSEKDKIRVLLPYG